MRGYGDSDKPNGIASYQVDKLTNDIKSLIKELGREKCILVCHDWGAVVGWNFIQNNMNMVERYVMMGAPSAQAWRRVIMSSEFFDQFKKSWYIFFFQMPRLPEYVLSLNDFAIFKAVGSGKLSDSYTQEDMEAYKYTFSRPGKKIRFFSFFFLRIERPNSSVKFQADSQDPSTITERTSVRLEYQNLQNQRRLHGDSIFLGNMINTYRN